MEAVAHNKEFAKKAGVAQSVGKDFAEADKGKDVKKLPESKSESRRKALYGDK